VLCVLLVLVLNAATAAAALPTLDEIKGAIPATHPRLYFTDASLPDLIAGLTPEKESYLAALASNNPDPVITAANDALTALFDGHTPSGAKAFLNANDPPNGYYYFTLRHYVSAFDWAYDSLSGSERTAIASKLVTLGQTLVGYSSDAKGDFYRPKLALLYIGLTLYGTGADADLVNQFLQVGYDEHLAAFAWREANGMDDGGVGDHTFAYNVGDSASTMQSIVDWLWILRGIGFDTTADLPSFGWYAHHVLRASFPVPEDELVTFEARHHGFGWEWHGTDQNDVDVSNEFRIPLGLLANLANLYPDSDNQAIASYLMSYSPRTLQSDVLQGDRSSRATPLLLDTWTTANDSRDFLQDFPQARHFEQGQVLVSSGWDEDATHIGFIGGTKSSLNHKNWDEGSFVIYKHGFLALDTGTRRGNGVGHLQNYYERTISHNALTVTMPGETFPNGLAGDVVTSNDGGQFKRSGSLITAFETNPTYSYWAVDLAPVYSSSKVSEITRQFVYVTPDYLVIFDRITSTDASYQKRFVYHAVGDFSLEDGVFSAEHLAGRVFGKTLYPADAVQTKVGGPGSEFTVEATNYPITQLHDLLGEYRIEVTPATEALSDQFLHLIQVGLADELTSMVESSLLEDAQHLGVDFTTLEGGACTIVFNKTGAVGGTIACGGSEATLATSIEAQAGVARETGATPGSGGDSGGGEPGNAGNGGESAVGGSDSGGAAGSGVPGSPSIGGSTSVGGSASSGASDSSGANHEGCGCSVPRSDTRNAWLFALGILAVRLVPRRGKLA
jgi:hypothetical protein